MADMRKAGLNPILAYQQGGASSPAGAMGTMPDLGAAVSRGVSSALQLKRFDADLALIKANTRLTDNKADVIKPGSVVGSTVGSALSSAKGLTGHGPDGNKDILHSLKQALGGYTTPGSKRKPTKPLHRGKDGKLHGGRSISRRKR